MSDTTTSSRTSAAGAGGKLEDCIRQATEALLTRQQTDGHWVFELETDCTISGGYVLVRHILGEEIDAPLQKKIAVYFRRIQQAHGGWPVFHGGEFNMSASVTAYFALKLIGDQPDADHMRRAREAIRARGGAAECNVFTRGLLALCGVVSWRAVPVMPVEIMLLPRWFPFHLSKVSFWARTTIVPMLVLQALKPKARNPRGVTIDELFLQPPQSLGLSRKAPHQKWPWFLFFRAVDTLLRAGEPLFPKRLRQRAIDKAVAFVTTRLNGDDGFSAIFPPMAYAPIMFDALGYSREHPHRAIAGAAFDKLLVVNADEAYCQPCVSPVWDTGLVCHALLEVATETAIDRAKRGLRWLKPRQILDIEGDWAESRPGVRPGGWAFQYASAYYPDVDDTAVVAMAMDRADRLANDRQYRNAIARAREWILGMQSRNGGWGAYDADNNHQYLNNIPFADHGALLDPPTEDICARCVSMLAQLGERAETSPALARAVEYLRRTQRDDGSWFGRWGINYIYGTWSALCALNAAGVEPSSAEMRKAVTWLATIQNSDGGWGEDCTSYKLDYTGYEPAPSTASQTAWALLGLMAAGDVDNPAVARGLDYLARNQGDDGLWPEQRSTGTGFPRILYLRYHGYSKYFPLWAMARYRNLKKANSQLPAFGL